MTCGVEAGENYMGEGKNPMKLQCEANGASEDKSQVRLGGLKYVFPRGGWQVPNVVEGSFVKRTGIRRSFTHGFDDVR